MFLENENFFQDEELKLRHDLLGALASLQVGVELLLSEGKVLESSLLDKVFFESHIRLEKIQETLDRLKTILRTRTLPQ